jgi:hypothetical protein
LELSARAEYTSAVKKKRSDLLILCCLPILILGCDDPELHITLSIPSDYRAELQTAMLRIHVAGGEVPLRCEEFEYNTVSQERADLSQTAEARVKKGELFSIPSVPRWVDKLLIVRGYDTERRFIVAGCMKVGSLEQGSSVRIPLEPTSRIETQTATMTESLPETIPVKVVGGHGEPLSKHAVHYESRGPDGFALQAETLATDESGNALLATTRAPVAGVQETTITSRWATEQPTVVRSYNAPLALLDETIPGALAGAQLTVMRSAMAWGRFGPNGEMGYAQLGPLSAPNTERALFVTWFANGAFRSPVMKRYDSVTAVAAVNRGQRDQLVLFSNEHWIEVDSNGDEIKRTAIATPSGSRVLSVQSVGACQGDTGDQLLVGLSDGSAIGLDENGQRKGNRFLQAFRSGDRTQRAVGAGCVLVSGSVRRVMIYRDNSLKLAVFDESDNLVIGGWSVLASTINFGFPGSGHGPLLLGAVSDIDGLALGSHLLEIADGKVEPSRQTAAPLTPVALTEGDFDGDGRLDLVSVLVFAENAGDEGVSAIRLFMSFDTTPNPNDKDLSGTSASFFGRDFRVASVDFDGDGVHELIVASRGRVRIFSFLEHGEATSQ